MVSLTIVKYSDITNLIIPFFKKYPVLGIKQNDFSDWCKTAKTNERWFTSHYGRVKIDPNN